jgi:hypothetical protein
MSLLLTITAALVLTMPGTPVSGGFIPGGDATPAVTAPDEKQQSTVVDETGKPATPQPGVFPGILWDDPRLLQKVSHVA